MSMLMYILVGLLGIVCLVVIFVLIAPFRYRFHYAYDGAHRFEAAISIGQYLSLLLSKDHESRQTLQGYWRMGIFKGKINIVPDKKVGRDKQTKRNRQTNRDRQTECDEQAKYGERTERKEKKQSSIQGVHLLSRSLIEDGFDALQDIVKIILPEYVKLSGRVGFYEPHHTAFLLALTGAITERIKILHLNIEPIWEEECLDIEINVAGKVILMTVIIRCIRFLLSKSARDTWKRWRASKKAKKFRYQS